MSGPHLGKFRGVVTDNADPQGLGRLRAQVPDALGEEVSTWALPCLPPGVAVVTPDPGTHVWVEFEHGEAAFPIWTGCWWSDPSDLPAEPGETDTGAGGITLAGPGGATITVTDDGIAIDNGRGASITLRGPKVSVNNGALEVI